jgi:hypothetical protein
MLFFLDVRAQPSMSLKVRGRTTVNSLRRFMGFVRIWIWHRAIPPNISRLDVSTPIGGLQFDLQPELKVISHRPFSVSSQTLASSIRFCDCKGKIPDGNVSRSDDQFMIQWDQKGLKVSRLCGIVRDFISLLLDMGSPIIARRSAKFVSPLVVIIRRSQLNTHTFVGLGTVSFCSLAWSIDDFFEIAQNVMGGFQQI